MEEEAQAILHATATKTNLMEQVANGQHDVIRNLSMSAKYVADAMARMDRKRGWQAARD